MRRLLMLAGLIVPVAGAVPAAAGSLDFDFSVTGGATDPGTFAGEIVGLTDNDANQAATAVYLTSSTIGFPYSLPFNTSADPVSVFANSFTVSDGQITAASYNAFVSSPNEWEIALNYEGTYLYNDPSEIRTDSGDEFSGITFTPVVQVPEPGSLPVFGVALAVLAFFARPGSPARRVLARSRI